MAKSKHNHLLDTIGDLILNAKKEGLVHLYTEGTHFDGRHIQVEGKKLFHFGTTGYLGLEQDQRLKDAAIDAIQRYGTQFPLSKTYVSFVIYKELEKAVRKIYNSPIVITKNSTLAHIGVIPTIVRDEDVLILDQQVHASVQNASQLLKARGTSVQLVKHNDVDMLENTLKRLRNKHQKIWYAADGVYSMFGDVVPLEQLLPLMERYPQLHLYIDDVHGMSWAGKHGAGYVMSKLGTLRERIVLVGTLSKSFGASGGVVAFGDDHLYEAFKVFGGPQTFSAQLEPPSVAAALASANIHLSDEIYDLQQDLAEKVSLCNQLIRKTDLPLIQENVCPVHFIGAALPAVSYEFAKRLMNDGFYVNVATFPVVPVKNTGIRFTISRHNQPEEIEALVAAMQYHYPKALEKEGYSLNQVRKAFKLPIPEEKATEVQPKSQEGLHVEVVDTICKVNPEEWNNLLGERGAFDWNALSFYEDVFTNHSVAHHRWDFIYLLIRDNEGKVVLATFFTAALWKDDVLAAASVSEQAELIRKIDPTYLTSRVLSMGSLITDGDHLYLNREHPLCNNALKAMSTTLESLKEKYRCNTVMVRDIADNDREINHFMHTQGYLQITLPESAVIQKLDWNSQAEYLSRLSSKSRSHIKNDIFKFQSHFDIEAKEKLSAEDLLRSYHLYQDVSNHNFAFNNVEFPFRLFETMNQDSNWEFITFRLKEEFMVAGDDPLVGVVFTYQTKESYCAVLLGMDYQYSREHKVYKQIIFHATMRARALGKERIFLGLTSGQEKKKYGATLIPRVGYLQAQDNYKLELVESMVEVA
ncbi:aminotransferase class I/II-fold pyridoxal phosphate-dependent enzyme [Tunicatimonas pelagia]|uniref:aminotransferase class I/II-fold pyridoxal phosphate-dependent enzyme n=1 Tax=Tunicatimonas pelagia TaxID=931531 RepID=UPI002665FA6D|nr:aminotransferase class I/II-fold pyridoxal phosphate-dependent enzyme [Tunicatimonas pelagia]WKN42005.1 aminotransferase class I/II-fold pyridoxal phosphate-dependent enzyme [Tunicatimonas pelagia]